MKIHVMAKTHDRYGGHPSLHPIGDFLLAERDDFGPAVREITLTLHLPDAGPAKRTLASLLATHEAYRRTLPKVTFRRSRATVEIEVASALLPAHEWRPASGLSLDLFSRGVVEVADALALVRSRIKASDAFDVAAFLAECAAARARIPTSADALQALAEALHARDRERWAALSEWERLDIDWQDYHARAREVLDDPFFWREADDFAPHGNDTGADLLADYRPWRRRHPDADPMQFLERLARQWGYDGVAGLDAGIADDAFVALAFAELKLRASCPAALRAQALAAAARQRRQAEDDLAWPHRLDRLAALARIDAVLNRATA